MDRRAKLRFWIRPAIIAVCLIAVMVWLLVTYQVPQRIIEATTDQCGAEVELAQGEELPEIFVPWEESELAAADWDEEDELSMELVLDELNELEESFDATPVMVAPLETYDEVFQLADGALGIDSSQDHDGALEDVDRAVYSYDILSGEPNWGGGPTGPRGGFGLRHGGYELEASRDLPGDEIAREQVIVDPETGEETDCFTGTWPGWDHLTDDERESDVFALGGENLLTGTMNPNFQAGVPQQALYQYGADEEAWAEESPGPMRAFDQESGETQWEYPGPEDGAAYAVPLDVVEPEQGEQRIIAARAELPEEDSVHGEVSTEGRSTVAVDGEPVFNLHGELLFDPTDGSTDPWDELRSLELDWSVVVLNDEGEELWAHELGSAQEFGHLEAYGDVVLHVGTTPQNGDLANVMRGFDLSTGELLWTEENLTPEEFNGLHAGDGWGMNRTVEMGDDVVWRVRGEGSHHRVLNSRTGEWEPIEDDGFRLEIKAATDTHVVVETGDRLTDDRPRHVVIFERN